MLLSLHLCLLWGFNGLGNDSLGAVLTASQHWGHTPLGTHLLSISASQDMHLSWLAARRLNDLTQTVCKLQSRNGGLVVG